jgi:hypothetical protein
MGDRINIEVLKDERAEYGQSIIEDLARSLIIEYGRSFEEKKFAPDDSICRTVSR